MLEGQLELPIEDTSLKDYTVPLTITYLATGFVRAHSPGEARDICEVEGWDEIDLEDLIGCQVDGKAEENV